MNDFEGRLKRERMRLGLNQSEFAAVGGVQKHAQFQYEKGMRRPNSDYLSAITAAGVDVHYLLTGEVATGTLNEEEQRILSGYRSLDPRQRAAIAMLIDALIVPPPSQSETNQLSDSD
jgi:transcriptional regulator with XRE-family HTH domain